MDLDPHVIKNVSSVATFIAKSRDVNPCKSHSLVESRNSRVSIETLDFARVRTFTCVDCRLDRGLVEHRLVTDGQTQTDMDTGLWLVPRMHNIAR